MPRPEFNWNNKYGDPIELLPPGDPPVLVITEALIQYVAESYRSPGRQLSEAEIARIASILTDWEHSDLIDHIYEMIVAFANKAIENDSNKYWERADSNFIRRQQRYEIAAETKPDTKLVFWGKEIAREEAVELIYEYYKHRIMLQDDDGLVEGFILYGKPGPLPTWKIEELQECLNSIAEEKGDIDEWPRTELHEILDQLLEKERKANGRK